ncbi:MAG: diacylglycerol kinase family lipid kinase [Polyangiaceae bacterium]|nr:diacylglycerol kinase family lipid kinase [Polyangiaceae bacterium]
MNPRAGGGRAGRNLESIRKTVENAIGAIDLALTERPRHAVELARDAARDGRAIVVATGGDGSIHEVVNGLMLAREEGHVATSLGIIGRGTGSDLCKTLGIEPRLDRFLSVLAARQPRTIDVGRFSYTDPSGRRAHAYFVNILSAGMGGLVDRYVADTGRWVSGPLAYFLASARALAKSEIGVLEARIELDGVVREVELRTRTVAICNGRYFGSGMHVAPMARVDDGVFDVVDLGGGSRLKYLVSGSAIYSAAHMKSPDVQHFRCNKIELSLKNRDVDPVFLLDVDGEPLGGLPLSVEVVKGALPVLLPPS